ncbi:MAG: molecular chaperone DjiA [Hyphomicrobiales bacterium]
MSIWQTMSKTIADFGGDVADALRKLTGVGQNPDDPETSVAFTIAVVALGAKMAKADGAVTEREIAAFREVFQVPPSEAKNLAYVFNQAKGSIAGYEEYAHDVVRLFGDRKEVLEDLLDGLFHIAKADGSIGEKELAYLQNVATIFGLGQRFPCIKARHLRAPSDDPYEILGVDPCIGTEELKRAYREMVKANHPDRHIAAGVPPEMVDIANRRLAAINAAYEQIAKARAL